MAGSTALTNKPSVLASTYGAKQFRNAFEPFAAMGVLSSTGFQLLQNGAGARSVIVSAGQAFIKPTAVTNQGAYLVQLDTQYVESNFTAADPTNPRVDAVVLEVKDTDEDGSGLRQAQTRVIDGTPTGGATLTNLAGAPATPSGTLLLGYTLLGAAATTILTAAISDRRIVAGLTLPTIAAGIYLSANNAPGLFARIPLDTAMVASMFTSTPGMVDTVNKCLVAPLAGMYDVTWFSASPPGPIYVTKNGGATITGTSDTKIVSNGTTAAVATSFLLSLSAGDTVGLAAGNASTYAGALFAFQPQTYLAIRRVGA